MRFSFIDILNFGYSVFGLRRHKGEMKKVAKVLGSEYREDEVRGAYVRHRYRGWVALLEVYAEEYEITPGDKYKVWYTGIRTPISVYKPIPFKLSPYQKKVEAEEAGPFFKQIRAKQGDDIGLESETLLSADLSKALNDLDFKMAVRKIPEACELICEHDAKWNFVDRRYPVYRLTVRLRNHKNAGPNLPHMVRVLEQLLDLLEEAGLIAPNGPKPPTSDKYKRKTKRR